MTLLHRCNRWPALVLAIAVLLSGGFACATELTLVKDGQPQAVIVTAENPTTAASLAAHELQWHVKAITGAELPIVKAPQDGKIALHVGDTPGAVQAGLTDWKPQQYALKFTDKAIMMAGQDEDKRGEVKYDFDDPFAFRSWPGLFDAQGTLHAVYRFLQKQVGVRWYTPAEAGIDFEKRATLTVRGDDVRRSPAFSYRDLGHIGNIAEGYDAGTQLWPANSPELKAYIEAAYPEMFKKWGGNRWKWIHGRRGWTRLWLLRNGMGGSEKYACNHSFYGYYDRFWKKNPKNAEVFVEKRPQYFAQGYPHRDPPPQMCYTNDGFIEQVIADARQYFDGKGLPYRALANGDFFALCPMDNSSYCKCRQCRSTMNKDELDSAFFSNGLWSDYQFGFYNKVARAIKQSHPEKYLSTLAYSKYARYPRDIKLESNIAVQLCLHVRNVYDVAQQKNDMDILGSWTTREKDRPIYLWLYYCFPRERGHRSNPQWQIFPGYFAHTVGERFKQYHEAGIRGAFFNGFGQEVEALVTFRMLQDPSESVDDILDEYFSRYYGDAGEPLKKMYLLIEKTYCDPANYTPNKRGRVGHQTRPMAMELYSPELLSQVAALMEQARGAVKTEQEKKRLELFELSTYSYMRAAVFETTELERQEKWKDHPAKLTKMIGQKPELKDNALRGKPFAYDTPGCLQILTDPRKVSNKPFDTLTDG
ncbi:MAG: DUF4838 domain-containing protein, partial [Planctomycetota bacterium]